MEDATTATMAVVAGEIEEIEEKVAIRCKRWICRAKALRLQCTSCAEKRRHCAVRPCMGLVGNSPRSC